MVRRTLRRTAVGLVAAGVLATVLTPTAAADADETPEQWRSYWVDGFNEGIYTPEQVDQLVADALAINANALIVQTVRRYDCFCNDALYPRTDAFVDPAPYDPLQEIIEDAHAAGLEVHAWVNVNTMWNSATPHSSPDHIANTHGLTATGADRWLNKKYDGTERVGNNVYVDPANPAAAEYIVEGIQSILDNYDVDGINLDYVRYPDFNSTTSASDWGYSETSIARFQAATGRTDIPEPADAEFSDWRRDQLTNLVRKIYLGMFEVDPRARLSMDGITYGFGPQSVGGWEKTRTYAEVLQDFTSWLDEGIMDTVVAMNYKRDWLTTPPGNNQAQMFDEWTEFLADNQADRQTVNGPGLYLNDIDSSVDQVIDTLTPTEAGNTAVGWSGYAYANPSNEHVDGAWEDRSAERDALAAALTEDGAPFAEDAAVPSMPWKENATTGNIQGTVTVDGAALDQLEVTLRPLGSGAPITRTTDGSGWFGFVDLAPGRYLVRANKPGDVDGNPTTIVTVTAGGLVAADIALVAAD